MGIRLTRTPSGTTIDNTWRHGCGLAPVPDLADFPWRVTATPDGEGGAYLAMTPGALIADTASGPVVQSGINLPASQRHVSSSGYVVLRMATDFSAFRVTYEAAVPANTEYYYYYQVAAVGKDGPGFAVTQCLAGAFLALVSVEEEI